LGWWLVAVAPSLLLLAPNYVLVSPRLMYVSSVGVALFYGALTAAVLRVLRRSTLRMAMLVLVALILAWCAVYVGDWVDEVSRYPAALRVIYDDMRVSNPEARVLLVNAPWWLTPAVPPFLVGTESLSLYHPNLLASVDNTPRPEQYVRHDISLTHGDRYAYVIVGDAVDDSGLRTAILRSNYVYRFDYDSPGLRVRRLGVVSLDADRGRMLAHLSRGNMQVTLSGASARACGDRLWLDLAWSDVEGMSEPVAIFVHGLDAQGEQVLSADRDLLEGYLPLDQVPPSVAVAETRLITLTPSAATVVTLSVGAYSRMDVQRFAATHADGRPWEGDAVPIPVQHTPESCQ
jgi:hypothetical protein